MDGQVQYVVPRWRRRYRWGQANIERLVEDPLTIAVAGPEAAHYGGALLTFPAARPHDFDSGPITTPGLRA